MLLKARGTPICRSTHPCCGFVELAISHADNHLFHLTVASGRFPSILLCSGWSIHPPRCLDLASRRLFCRRSGYYSKTVRATHSRYEHIFQYHSPSQYGYRLFPMSQRHFPTFSDALHPSGRNRCSKMIGTSEKRSLYKTCRI